MKSLKINLISRLFLTNITAPQKNKNTRKSPGRVNLVFSQLYHIKTISIILENVHG